MKFNTFIVTLASVLSAVLAFSNPKVAQVHSEVMSYVHENMDGIRMMRGSSAQLMCYDDFIPLINELANEAKQRSAECVDFSDEQKGNASAFLTASRAELSGEVKRVQDSLTACVESPDNMGFFECLIGLVDEDKHILDNIGRRSSALIDQYAERNQGIEADEQTCHRKAVDDAKAKSDSAFESLRKCMAIDRPSIYPTTEATSTPDYYDYTNW